MRVVILVLVFCVGVLACLDGYMNIVLEQTEEYLNGQVIFCHHILISAMPEYVTVEIP